MVGGTFCALQRLVLRSFLFVIIGLFSVFSSYFHSIAEAKDRYAAMVVDSHSGKVLYARNVDKPRYPASLTKIMTLYLLFQEIKAGKIGLNTEFVVTKNASLQAPSKLGLKVGQKIKVKDGIRALVTKSANDVACVIAENLAGTEERFARVMTMTAKKLGMKNTQFRNASGLPNSAQVTTARDMVILSRRMINDFPKMYKVFGTRTFSYKGKRYNNHNRLLFNYKGTDGIKTGYTRASGFNLAASVRRNNKHLVAVVMGGKTGRKRDAHMRHILNKAMPKAVAVRWKPKPKKQQIARNQQPARDKQVSAPAQSYETAAATVAAPGPYHVQVGAFASEGEARARLTSVGSKAQDLLGGHSPITTPGPKGRPNLVRARFSAFSKAIADSTCAQMKRRSIDCMVLKAE